MDPDTSRDSRAAWQRTGCLWSIGVSAAILVAFGALLQASRGRGRILDLGVKAAGIVALLAAAGALGAGGYFAWQKLQSERKSEARAVTVDADESEPEGAVIPKAPPVAPPKPEVAKAPAPAPKPEAPPVTPQYQTLEVATLAEVWLRVVVDGKTAFIGILPKGQTKTFQGKVIDIRSGKAGAVQLKLDGQLQPPLEGGSLKIPGSRRFAMPAAPPAAPPSAPNPAAAQPSGT